MSIAAKSVLAGLLVQELAELLKDYPSFRARQIHKWICSGAGTFGEMSNLPLALRHELAERYSLLAGTPLSQMRDTDGTVKLGISLEDGAVIEAVILRDGEGRSTACLSTQAGCASACVFCKTDSLGFKRNQAADYPFHLRHRKGHTGPCRAWAGHSPCPFSYDSPSGTAGTAYASKPGASPAGCPGSPA